MRHLSITFWVNRKSQVRTSAGFTCYAAQHHQLLNLSSKGLTLFSLPCLWMKKYVELYLGSKSGYALPPLWHQTLFRRRIRKICDKGRRFLTGSLSSYLGSHRPPAEAFFSGDLQRTGNQNIRTVYSAQKLLICLMVIELAQQSK